MTWKPRWVLETKPAAVSWWLDAARGDFTARCEQEMLRMSFGRCASAVQGIARDLGEPRRRTARVFDVAPYLGDSA